MSLPRLLCAVGLPHALELGRVLSVLGIALGVALGYAVHLVNRAAIEELTAAVRSTAGGADLEIDAGRSGMPDSLLPSIARLQEVALASPVVEVEAELPGRGASVRVLGVDPLRATPMQQGLPDGGSRYGLLEPDTAVLTAAAARALRLAQGDALRLRAGAADVTLRVIGVLPEGALAGTSVLADIATVQWRFSRIGWLTRIALTARQGADLSALREQVSALVPQGVRVASPEDAEHARVSPSRAYRVNLNVLALVALFTGGFVVFSSEALQVARRRREHALLRVLGLERAALARLVLLEAGAIGLIGGCAGLLIGHGIAAAALRLFGGDLGAGFFRMPVELQGVDVAWSAGYLAVAVLLALGGAFLPARDAARTPPALALKAGDEQAMHARVFSGWLPAVLLVAGAVLALLPPVNGLPVFGYAAIACILIGAIALMPRLFQTLLRAISLRKPAPLALALAQLRGAPGQSMVSLSSIVASFSLMVAMVIMVGSFRHSLDEWLEAVLPADLYLRADARLAPDFVAGVRSSAAFSRVLFARSVQLVLDPARPAVTLVARDLFEGDLTRAYPMIGARYERRTSDPPGVLASEAMADVYGFYPGTRVRLALGGQPREFVVLGTFRDYARQHGSVILDRAVYASLTGDTSVSEGALWRAPGVTEAQAISLLRGTPRSDGLEVSSSSGLRSQSLRIFDRSFAVTYALEAAAVLIGLFGLSSSLGAIVLARRREFGMLRHVGVERAQIGRMLGVEGGLLAAAGALAGLASGFVVSLILIHVVNRQSFNWSMDLHVPYGTLAALSAGLIALAVLTAWISGREAMGQGPVRAVREDW